VTTVACGATHPPNTPLIEPQGRWQNSLIPIRKPFDVLDEGLLLEKSRGEPRCTFPNDLMPVRLLWQAITHGEEFTADTFFTLAEAIDLATPT
jgi:hypothetical protein